MADSVQKVFSGANIPQILPVEAAPKTNSTEQLPLNTINITPDSASVAIEAYAVSE